jgi:uncharacterized protein
MDALYIPHLTKLPDRTQVIDINEHLLDLETLTPVKGQVAVTHQVTYLNVSAQAETIVTLTCDRCLQQYNHRLKVKTAELIWLDEAACQIDQHPLEEEIDPENLVEALSPHGYFQPDHWLYEQLCLALPLRQLCRSDCPGIAIAASPPAQEPIDERWSSLAALKKQLES